MPSPPSSPPPSSFHQQPLIIPQESTIPGTPSSSGSISLIFHPDPHASDQPTHDPPDGILLSSFSSLHPDSYVGGASSLPASTTALEDHHHQPNDLESSFMRRTRSGPPSTRTNDSAQQQQPQAAAHEPPSPSLATLRVHASPSASWWGGSPPHIGARSILPRRLREMPADEQEARMRTKERVALAVRSVLGTTSDIAHELLTIGVDFAQYAPVPGLASVAGTLLQIWDAVENVDLNSMICLRLTERCAETLIAVREEVHSAGGDVSEELQTPVKRLEDSFQSIARILEKEASRAFLKRYLKRDEILFRLSECETDLRDALGMFNLRIQIKIIRQLKEAEKKQQSDTQAIIDTILAQHRSAPPNALRLEGLDQQDSTLQTPPPEALQDPDNLTPEQIPTALSQYYAAQDAVDMAKDAEELRQLIHSALQTSSDAAMLEVLQIKRQEMPEAIKTLQRALERTIERDSETESPRVPPPKPPVSPLKKLSFLAQSSPKRPPKIDPSSTSTESSARTTDVKDTLHREFLESGIDALKRMSHGVETNLPSWTITKFEIDHDHKIGIGFFSDVYKGSWNGRSVAIKVLAETTPRELFKREVTIWKTLKHPNVLELYGASSTSGSPPWFFVSPYEKNGSLFQFLKRIQTETKSSNSTFFGRNPGPPYPAPSATLRMEKAPTYPIWPGVNSHQTPPGAPLPLPEPSADYRKSRDLHRFMYEIAKGMQYLHSQNVLHGDLKAANVLVDDRFHCVITDFGQSEMKSEACRLSGKTPPHGTLRWQAPELISGSNGLTQAMDVYAYAICCIEILTWGDLPWGHQDDGTVRYNVLEKNERPPFPPDTRYLTPLLKRLIQTCWDRDPGRRPPFTKIVAGMKQVRKAAGDIEDIISPRFVGLPELNEHPHRPSPDIRPIDLPRETTPEQNDLPNAPHRETSVPTDAIRFPEPVLFTPAASRGSSMLTSISSGESEESESQENIHQPHRNGTNSPAPEDELAIQGKNERRYRMVLKHDYHPSLVLPLWDPSPVELGSVGYLEKPRGAFVTLFNALQPTQSNIEAIRAIPPITIYGNIIYGSRKMGKKTNLLDTIMGLLVSRRGNDDLPVSRRYHYPLKAGHKAAFLCVENAEYQYMMSDENGHLDVPKHWFKLHVDTIMDVFSPRYPIHREDLFLVVGTLRAPKYALFVSHNHPEGHAHFNVFAAPKVGQPWGMFTTDSVYDGAGPPVAASDELSRQSASKVSSHGDSSNSVLIARLRFRTDKTEPTLMYR